MTKISRFENFEIEKIGQISPFWRNPLCSQNACKFWFGLVRFVIFSFVPPKCFLIPVANEMKKKSLQFVWTKVNAFFIDLDRFLQQKEFIVVRLVCGFRQDYRKMFLIFDQFKNIINWKYQHWKPTLQKSLLRNNIDQEAVKDGFQYKCT